MNSNEKRLLIVFSIAIFLIANGLGFFMISKAMDNVQREKNRLGQRISKLNNAKTQADEAQQARDWMDSNVKTYKDDFQRDSHLDSLVNGALSSGLKLDIRKNFPLRTDDKGEHFVKSRYQATVQGKWLDVKEFIFRLQKPSELRFVPKITMDPRKSETDDAEQDVEITVELEQWWARPDNFVSTAEEPAPANEQSGAAPVESPASATPADPAPPAEPEASPAPTPTETPKPNP